jgi:hypothetical protein
MKRVYLPPTGPVCPTCNEPRRVCEFRLSGLGLPDEGEPLKFAFCTKCESYLLLSHNPAVPKETLDTIGKSQAKLFSDRVQRTLKQAL